MIISQCNPLPTNWMWFRNKNVSLFDFCKILDTKSIAKSERNGSSNGNLVRILLTKFSHREVLSRLSVRCTKDDQSLDAFFLDLHGLFWNTKKMQCKCNLPGRTMSYWTSCQHWSCFSLCGFYCFEPLFRKFPLNFDKAIAG